MDGEQLLVYVSLASLVGQALLMGVVFLTRKGREEGVRASDVADLRKVLHEVRDLINVRPTHEMVTVKMALLETQLRLEISKSEARVAAAAVGVADTAAKVLAAAAAKG